MKPRSLQDFCGRPSHKLYMGPTWEFGSYVACWKGLPFDRALYMYNVWIICA